VNRRLVSAAYIGSPENPASFAVLGRRRNQTSTHGRPQRVLVVYRDLTQSLGTPQASIGSPMLPANLSGWSVDLLAPHATDSRDGNAGRDPLDERAGEASEGSVISSEPAATLGTSQSSRSLSVSAYRQPISSAESAHRAGVDHLAGVRIPVVLLTLQRPSMFAPTREPPQYPSSVSIMRKGEPARAPSELGLYFRDRSPQRPNPSQRPRSNDPPHDRFA